MSLIIQHFVQQFIQVNNNKHIKVPHHCSFLRGIHWSPVDSPHKGPVMQEAFPCHDIITVARRFPSHPLFTQCTLGKINPPYPSYQSSSHTQYPVTQSIICSLFDDWGLQLWPLGSQPAMLHLMWHTMYQWVMVMAQKHGSKRPLIVNYLKKTHMCHVNSSWDGYILYLVREEQSGIKRN